MYALTAILRYLEFAGPFIITSFYHYRPTLMRIALLIQAYDSADILFLN